MSKRVSAIKKLGCVLALTGLALRLAVALLHVPSGAAILAQAPNTPDASSRSFPFEIVYCTVHGSMKVPASDADTSRDELPSNNSANECPLCQAVAAIDTALNAQHAALPLPATLKRAAARFSNTAAAPTKPERVVARGPPSLIV